MESNLQKLPMDIINHIKSLDQKIVYYVFKEYGEYSDYSYDFIGIYSSLQKAINVMINGATNIKSGNNENSFYLDHMINTYIKIYRIDDGNIYVYDIFDLPNKNYILSLKDDKLVVEYEDKIYHSNKIFLIDVIDDIKNKLKPDYKNKQTYW